MSLLKIQVDFPSLELEFKKHQAEANLLVMATAQTNRGMLFDQEGGYNGHKKWAPLKMRDGQILSKRGVLRKSIAPHNASGKPGPEGIATSTGLLKGRIGTKVAYAPIQNFGGVIKAKTGKVMSWMNDISGKRMFAMSVTIPARNFTAWNSKDQEELDETLTNFIMQKVFK